MGLEIPLALLGLLAVGIPWLVHRMRKRELPRVVLPTFMLLQRAAAQSQSKRALSDMLLLALRIGLVVLACLAVAAPYVTARVAFGDGKVAAAAIVIDDSLSMSREAGAKTLFQDAVARATQAIEALPADSEVAVVLSGRPARVLVGMSNDLGQALRRVESLPARALRDGDLENAIGLATRELTRAHQASRRLLVLSDFARHETLDSRVLSPRVLADVAAQAVRVGPAPDKGNLFIEEVTAAADPTQRGKTSIAVEARVADDGLGASAMISSARAEVLGATGQVLATQSFDLRDGRGRVTLSIPTPPSDSDPSARVRLVADDALALDNEAAVVLTRADAVRVLLVNGDPRPGNDADELRYLSRALALLPEREIALSVRNVDALALAHVDLREVDVVLLANVLAPDATVAQKLIAYVQRGGGLIVAAGDQLDPNRYMASLGPLLGAHITRIAGADGSHFVATAAAWPAGGLLGLKEAQSSRRLEMEASDETLLAFDDGMPALVARNVGAGRVLLFGVSVDADWSDLPLRPGFLALLTAMLREAAGVSAAASRHLVPGDVAELPVPRNTSRIEVRDPQGEVHALEPKAGQHVVRFTQTDAFGTYRLFAASASNSDEPLPRGAFVVRAPRAESDLTPGKVPSVARTEGSAGAAQATVHRPLSSAVLFLVFALVLVEGVARLRKR